MNIYKRWIIGRASNLCLLCANRNHIKWRDSITFWTKCKLIWISNQYMNSTHEKEGLTDQLMLLLCSIFGQIYTRGECLSEHDTCVYYVRYSTNIKSWMKKLYCILIKIWIDLNIKLIHHYYQWDWIFDWIGYFVVSKQILIKI